MLGAFSVGKTSLVEQFVHSIFTDKYLSTVGVKISKKVLSLDGRDATLVLWDMEGKDLYADINLSYLRGAMGYFVVVDGLRKETVRTALDIHALAREKIGPLPCFFLFNKADLESEWEITADLMAEVEASGVPVLRTSAKTGQGVEEAFTGLAKAMLQE